MTEFEDINFEDILGEGFNIVAEEINLSDLNVDNEKNSDQNIFPILPVRNMVMFPNVVIPITAGRKTSIQFTVTAGATSAKRPPLPASRKWRTNSRTDSGGLARVSTVSGLRSG